MTYIAMEKENVFKEEIKNANGQKTDRGKEINFQREIMENSNIKS